MLTPHNPDDAPTWTISGGSGYGHRAYTPGKTLRESWWNTEGPAADQVPGGRADRGLLPYRVSGIVTVVTAESTYVENEGMSVGVGEQQGHLHSAQVRAATPAEAAEVLAAEATRRVRTGIAERVRSLLGAGLHSANLPTLADTEDGLRQTAAEHQAMIELPQVPLGPVDRATRHPADLYLDSAAGVLWLHEYTALWGWRTRRLPLTPERQALVAALHAAYNNIGDWERTGVPAEAAAVLLAAGRIPHELVDPAVAVSISSVEDAHAYLSRTTRQWEQALWRRHDDGRRWPAADAARLAEAGISYSHAQIHHRHGLTSVEDILAARPPQLPQQPGRFILGGNNGSHQATICNNPADAEQIFGNNPTGWTEWQHTPGVRVEHVFPGGGFGEQHRFQLWSDGVLTYGLWYEPPGSRRERPVSLSAAAEQLIGLLVNGGSPLLEDPASWRPLLGVTATTVVELDRHETEDVRDYFATGLDRTGGIIELIRLDSTLPDGTTHTLYQVVRGQWSIRDGEGDSRATHWFSTEEQEARRYYREHRAAL
ncbi:MULTISPECIES: hypothetical protein [unclassified Crossiella]|uniref:hypothetical protein n=1 Tax=unclassified Crossiella TaxID=2620835 RepID=UPI001FFFE15A|nr:MULTISPECIES: hypothetical protein [unclassified Crossiella]MCK2245437.1 hypothetical protein [Crossiella sp. S99.2]MCK2259089.1 hypothetical protein [Crossiella sp. S99.1]